MQHNTQSRAKQALQQKSLDVLLIRGSTDGSTIQWSRNVRKNLLLANFARWCVRV